jgi:hypothetical protein
MIRACFTLPNGNDTEHSYALSIFGAWMLKDGIQQYIESTRQMFAHGLLDAGECCLQTETATTQATKLREWLVAVEPDYLQDTIKDVDGLLAELASDQNRFDALFAAERARRVTEDDDVLPEMDFQNPWQLEDL